MTFLDRMPRAGETLIGDVSLDSFTKNGDTRIFFYTYNCAARELSGRVRPVLAMKGIAGFFDDEQLNQGKGVAGESVHKRKDNTPPEPFTPPLRCAKTAFDERDIRALSECDLASCFGPAYAQPGRNPALFLPPPVLRLIDRITFVDPTGGDFGLGLVEAEKDLQLDAWYFQCHFKNDLCLPGTVVGEGCSQVLQFYLLYLGMQTHTTGARFQPIPGVEMIGQSRGQITPQLGTVHYRLTVTDVGLSPRPFAIGDIDVMFNGKIVARCKQLGLQLLED
jgi:3-hydroxymyristoyl/3-hydroxydecanoyl-(acyl carrier protein) dehydratase